MEASGYCLAKLVAKLHFPRNPPEKELLSSGAWVGEAVGAGLTGQQPKQTGFMGVEQKPLSSLFLFPD